MALWCNLTTDSLSGVVTPATGSAISVSFWMRTDPRLRAAAGQQHIYEQLAATNGFLRVRINTGGGIGTVPALSYIMATSAGSSGNVSATIPDLIDGRWHHVVITDGNGTVRVWCDGRVRGSGTTSRSVGYTGAVTTKIAGTANTNGFHLYDVQAFSRVLTKGEIAALGEGLWIGPSGRYLVGEGVTGHDFSGNGNHLDTVSALNGRFSPSENPPWVRAGMSRSRYLSLGRLGFVSGGAPPSFTGRGLWFTR